MKPLSKIYNLREDKWKIKAIQEASLDRSTKAGFKVEDGLLFGTDQWFRAIKAGGIKIHIITGKITKVFMSGHNDYPEFEILSNDGKQSIWTREGDDNAYKIGKLVELSYVEQKLKHPLDITGLISKCVLQIMIEM